MFLPRLLFGLGLIVRLLALVPCLFQSVTEGLRGILQRLRDAVGVTAGASAPERLVGRVCDWFRARGVTDIRISSSLVEDVFFRLPVELRRATSTAA